MSNRLRHIQLSKFWDGRPNVFGLYIHLEGVGSLHRGVCHVLDSWALTRRPPSEADWLLRGTSVANIIREPCTCLLASHNCLLKQTDSIYSVLHFSQKYDPHNMLTYQRLAVSPQCCSFHQKYDPLNMTVDVESGLKSFRRCTDWSDTCHLSLNSLKPFASKYFPILMPWPWPLILWFYLQPNFGRHIT